ncbi:MAG: hypothetical protein ACRDK9_13635, partial [Solirubrobacterales bacterium]
ADEVEPNPPSGAESAVGAAILDLGTAIAAYREAAAMLSEPEQRRTAMSFLAEDAAELVVMRGVRGDEPVPVPFVTGAEEEPLVELEPVEEDE